MNSVVKSLVEDQGNKSLSEAEAAWASATLYAVGAETTSGQMIWLILAMVLHPEIQKRAQEEIDRIVGRDRLPCFKDYEDLPYIRAMVKEILGWRGVAPLSVPHRLCEDDWYEGYFLPEDTICIANVLDLNQDPDVYGPDADFSRPERHIDPETGNLKAAPVVPRKNFTSHTASVVEFVLVDTLPTIVSLLRLRGCYGLSIFSQVRMKLGTIFAAFDG